MQVLLLTSISRGARLCDLTRYMVKDKKLSMTLKIKVDIPYLGQTI